MGAGAQSCGSWLAVRAKHGEHYEMAHWALGFLSAYNGGVDPHKNTDANAVMYWLDSYCQKYPTDRFSEALVTFVMFAPVRQ